MGLGIRPVRGRYHKGFSGTSLCETNGRQQRSFKHSPYYLTARAKVCVCGCASTNIQNAYKKSFRMPWVGRPDRNVCFCNTYYSKPSRSVQRQSKLSSIMLFTKQSLVAYLAMISTAMALPTATPVDKQGVAPNTQSCTAEDHFSLASYSVDIGITYANGIGCNDVYNALMAETVISNWQCVDDGAGGTQLWFNAGQGKFLSVSEKLSACSVC
jgi:hypothetical protein